MKKTLITVVLTAVVCFAIVGTTLAWLMDKTDPITNTFTVGNVDIELTETENLDLKMVPGKTITKDPTVTVKANSEACWLFVKVDESIVVTNGKAFSDYIGYTVNTASGEWTALDGVDGVYYRKVAATTADTDIAVLTGNAVTVKNTVTKDMIEAFYDANGAVISANLPKLTFTAYAVQQENVTDTSKTDAENAAAAWAIASATTTP